MDPHDQRVEDSQPPLDQRALKGTRSITSTDLFADAREVQIEHAGETYRLRMTKAGKLILTK